MSKEQLSAVSAALASPTLASGLSPSQARVLIAQVRSENDQVMNKVMADSARMSAELREKRRVEEAERRAEEARAERAAEYAKAEAASLEADRAEREALEMEAIRRSEERRAQQESVERDRWGTFPGELDAVA